MQAGQRVGKPNVVHRIAAPVLRKSIPFAARFLALPIALDAVTVGQIAGSNQTAQDWSWVIVRYR